MFRSRSLTRLVPIFLVISLQASGMASADSSWDFCVAPNGNDNWSGKLTEPNAGGTDGPFSTLDRARLAVRELRAAKPEADIAVAIRGGYYRLKETLVFGKEDGTSGTGTTTYAAYTGEAPVLGSGVPVTGWTRVESAPDGYSAVPQGQLWFAPLPEGKTEILTLYQGMNRLPRARGEGFAPLPFGPKDHNKPFNIFKFPTGFLANHPNLDGAEVLVIPTANYEMCILPLAYVDREKELGVTSLDATRAIGGVKFHPISMWLENIPAALDEPGEWVYDAKAAGIYFWPGEGEPVADIVAPKLTELIRVEGDIHYYAPEDDPVRNIKFRGLTFTHGERRPWDGLTTTELQHSWEHFDVPSGLVRLRGAEGCVVENCRFISSGGTGIRLDLHCKKNRVAGGEFANLGQVGILLAGYGPGTKDVNCENEISNNWVHDIGELYWASPGIFVWQSSRNRVANNLVHNVPYSGIVVSGRIGINLKSMRGASSGTVRWHDFDLENPPGWTWPETEPYLHARLNLVERNDIHHVMEKLGDGNFIYVSGAGRENRIRENYCHDSVADHLVTGIRCDDHQEETIIERNILYNFTCMHEAITIKGKNHIINNVMANMNPTALEINPARHMAGLIGLTVNSVTGSIIHKNIMVNTQPVYKPFYVNKVYGTISVPKIESCDVDWNLYHSPDDPEWGKEHLENTRPMGLEAHSVVADPMFVDLAKGDFRLREDSPALKLGFEPIDVTLIGLLEDHPYFVKPTEQ